MSTTEKIIDTIKRIKRNTPVVNKCSWPQFCKFCYYYGCERFFLLGIGAFKKNGIKSYWSYEVNFGDLITPFLLRHYGYTPIFTHASQAQLAATGSILEHLPNNYDGIILGSGFMHSNSSLLFPNAKILAVRGKLTRERLGRGDEVMLGDPGLLASYTISGSLNKKFLLGIIPHYLDKTQPNFRKLQEKFGGDKNIAFINVRQSPDKVFEIISSCEYIISSSLHGLIAADSFGIPNAWIASNNLFGGRFKFDDYYSSIDIIEEPFFVSGNETINDLIKKTTHKSQKKINKIKQNIDTIFRSLLYKSS